MLPIRGREAELALLLAAWDNARAARPRLLIVSGEPGAGKTRLSQELYTELKQRHDPPQPGHPDGYWPAELAVGQTGDGMRPALPERAPGKSAQMPYLWWALRCAAGNQLNPESFAPFIEALQQIDAQLRPMLATKLRGKAYKDLAVNAVFTVVSVTALVVTGGLMNFIGAARDLKSFWGDFTKARDGAKVGGLAEKDAKSLEEALLRYFTAFNDKKHKDWPDIPVVLVFDDAQWADARSMAFLNRLLLTALEQQWQLLILVTVRDNELAAQKLAYRADPTRPVATLAELRSSAVRKGGAEALVDFELEPQLAADSAGSVIADVIRDAGGSVLPGSIAALQDRAGGQPSYLVQYARLLLQRGWLNADGELTCSPEQLAAIPSEIEMLIDQRLELLPPDQRQVLEWGSVQGQRFAEELVRSMATRLGQTGDAATLALGDLRGVHRTLDSVPPPPDGLRRYEFTHRLLYERALAHCTEEELRLVQECMVDLLLDWQDSGRLELLPPAERREALVTLADAALKRCCTAQADDRWAMVAVSALRDLLDLLVAVSDYRAAEPWAEKLLEQLQRMEGEHQWTPEMCSAALRACGPGQQALRIRGQYEDRLRLLEIQLVSARGVQNDITAAEALRNIGSVHEDHGEFAKALEYYTQALDLNERAADDYGRAKTLKYMANAYLYVDHVRAAQLYQQCYEIQQAIGDERGAARTRMGIALSRHHAGDLESALELYGGSIAASEQLGDFHAAALAYNNLALLHMERGELDTAEPILRRNRETMLSIGDDYGAAMTMGNLGVIQELRGDYAGAVELGEQCLATEERLGEQHGMAETLLHLARSHIKLGQYDRAAERLRMSISRYERSGNTTDILEAREMLAQLENEPAVLP